MMRLWAVLVIAAMEKVLLYGKYSQISLIVKIDTFIEKSIINMFCSTINVVVVAECYLAYELHFRLQ